MGKVGKSVSKGFKKATKSVSKGFKKVTKEIGRVPKNVGGLVAGATGGGASGGTTVIQQVAEKAKQRYASEEGQATEQGATDLKTRLGVNNRKKIKRLSTVKKK